MPAMPMENSSILAKINYGDLEMKDNLMGGVRKELSPNDTASPTTATINNKTDSNKCALSDNKQHSNLSRTNSNTTNTTSQSPTHTTPTTTTTTTTPMSTAVRAASTTTPHSHSSSSSSSQRMGSTTTSDPTKSRNSHDYRFGKSIGEGSFSTVYLAKDIHTLKEYAIKVCEKQLILREKKQEYIKREREVMHKLSNVPGFVNLSWTFQDNKNLYFVMTYAKNGDLLPHLNKVGSFDLSCSRFYAAELVLALENMHRRGIVHRDLKPENILFDERMHTMIADFGSAKIMPATTNPSGATSSATDANTHLANGDEAAHHSNRKRKNSFVGTAQYVSPEILNGLQTTVAADLWALGCIIYQMISGLPPFRAGTDYLIFQKILKLDLTFPEGFDRTAQDLVAKLLQIEPQDRLGATDAHGCYTSIRRHPFFDGLDWTTLRTQTPPPIHPYLPGVDDEVSSADQYRVPDHLETGLDDRQLTRLMGLELGTAMPDAEKKHLAEKSQKNILDITDADRKHRIELQKSDKWHQFVDGELILKQGFVNKRKGLFARKRMLLLTTGPRLVYVDPVQMVKKGEIPWSADLRVETKNFKIFFVHTPNRTYYLEDAAGFALDWCQTIDEVRQTSYLAQA